jgi:UDP-N-acetylmuramate--alanine ligase
MEARSTSFPAADAPFSGRRIWFAGIGGAGLSAYAVLAKAWGAEVAGWDRIETPYLAYVRQAGIDVNVSPESPPAPVGWETVVSTAYASRIPGTRRAQFLAQIVASRPSIVVAGAHGKTTTTAMIAFCLDRLGYDPAFLIGGEVPQLGGNARAGSGWLVVEGDESDRTIAQLRPEIAVVTNLDLDHHSTFASRAELEDLFADWLAHVPSVVRGEALEPLITELAVPGEHNRRNAACALAALELAGIDRAEAARALVEFEGVGRRFDLVGEADGISVYDDYAHNPAKLAALVAAARERSGGRVLVAFQPHLYSRTRHLARELAAALVGADAVCVTDVYAAREDPVDGIDGKLVVDAATELRPGLTVGWTPALDDAAAFLARRARTGDLVLTVGAGDIDRAAPLVLELLTARGRR